jgi:hypothetical protein
MKLDETKNYNAVLVVLEDKLTQVDLSPGCYPGSFTVFHNGTQVTTTAEYDNCLDAYYHKSDDGNEFYLRMHILENQDQQAVHSLPDPVAVKNESDIAIQTVTTSIAIGETDMVDLPFAIGIFQSTAMIYRAWLETGSISRANKKILFDVFRL